VVQAAITLWRVRSHDGTRYFTRLKEACAIKGHRHVVIAWFDPQGRAVLWIRHAQGAGAVSPGPA
jgi:diadenosine tetraphosphatase ApaH/serine/threonine PP2A family protein phosphatase